MPSSIPCSLTEWLAYASTCHRETLKLGLSRVTAVAQKAGVFPFPVPVITVAGTNGKGSTVTILTALLCEAGLRVGTYLSPHLFDFRERIQIQGQFASEEQLCEAFAYVASHRGQIPLTFFEWITLVALVLFLRQALDVVVLEVGLGGRLDAVNVVDPSLAIITAIGLDHCDRLGGTLSAIALEKAGILRPHIPLVLSRQAQIPSLLGQAKLFRNPLYLEGEAFDGEAGSLWSFPGEAAFTVPWHVLPRASVSLALAAYIVLGKRYLALPPVEKQVECLEGRAMLGRFFSVEIDQKTHIFDVGHNGLASQWLAHHLQQSPCRGKTHVIWASMRDKNLEDIIAPLKSHVQTWYVGDLPNIERAATRAELEGALRAQGIFSVMARNTLWEAYQVAYALAEAGDRLLIFGSFHTVAEIGKRLGLERLQVTGLTKILTMATSF